MVLKVDTGDFQNLLKNWMMCSQILKVPETDSDLDRLIELSDFLMDNPDEDSSVEGLLHVVGTLIAEYESKNVEEPQSSPIGVLEFFLDQHGLKQKDLVEVGSPGVISEVMNGKRELNKRQIKALAKRFNCSPAVFF